MRRKHPRTNLTHDQAAELARQHPGQTYHTGWHTEEVCFLYEVSEDGILRRLIHSATRGPLSEWREVL